MVVVALDIGHGSNTFPPSKGVYKNGKGFAEHDFNSELVKKIEPLLKASGIDVLVYQKPNSVDVPLRTRTNYYNSKKVRLVYSIHANYNGNTDVNGICAFYWHKSSTAKRLAEIVIEEVKKKGYGTHGNGLHASTPGTWTDLHICRETDMDAVLVENGFMSGNKDFDYIFGKSKSKYIKDLSEAHAKAICRFLGVNYKGGEGQGTVDKPKPSKPTAPSKPSKPSTSVKPNYNTTSLVTFLQSIKHPYSLNDRKKLANYYGVGNGKYSGKANENVELLTRVKADYKKNGKLRTSKPVVNKPTVDNSFKGKRVESKVNGLRFYSKLSWEDKNVVGKVNKGIGFPTIVSKHKVGNGEQYKVKNSRGVVYYITASSKYVTVK